VAQRVVEVNFYSFKTSALKGGESSASRPCRTSPPGKTRYPFYRRLQKYKLWNKIIYLSFRSCDSCRRLPEPKHHSFLFNQLPASKCLIFMAARTPSIHVFLGRPLFLLSPGIHSIINFDSLSSCILLRWSYHWSLFLSMMSIMSGFSFTPIISFICSFFILSILDFLADLLAQTKLTIIYSEILKMILTSVGQNMRLSIVGLSVKII